MSNTHTIIYFGPLLGGFAKRMELLAEVLAEAGPVKRIHTLAGLLGFLLSKALWRGRASVVVYSDLMAPLVALLRCLRPSLRVYYMVRGDQVTWARHAGRNFRAHVAIVLQKLMVLLGCRMVFASDDLRKAFRHRLGPMPWARLLPNTLGRPLPDIRAFDGRLAVVGDFGTVKNVEHVIAQLGDGQFQVDLYGNRSVPPGWRRRWLHAHGVVADLQSCLQGCSLVVLASLSEGFPNVLLDALQAGCGVLVHRDFPFEQLPIGDPWRFDLNDSSGRGDDLASVLQRLLHAPADFKQDNRALVHLVESDWRQRVWDVFDCCRCDQGQGLLDNAKIIGRQAA